MDFGTQIPVGRPMEEPDEKEFEPVEKIIKVYKDYLYFKPKIINILI
jgi:hypothetical protein